MYFVLRHPGYEWRAGIAALFVLQSALTLVLVASGRPEGVLGRPEGLHHIGLVASGWTEVLRYLVLAGARGIAWAGYSAVSSMLSGPHFEGFALVIGAALVLQGVLTLVTLARQLPLSRLTTSD